MVKGQGVHGLQWGEEASVGRRKRWCRWSQTCGGGREEVASALQILGCREEEKRREIKGEKIRGSGAEGSGKKEMAPPS